MQHGPNPHAADAEYLTQLVLDEPGTRLQPVPGDRRVDLEIDLRFRRFPAAELLGLGDSTVCPSFLNRHLCHLCILDLTDQYAHFTTRLFTITSRFVAYHWRLIPTYYSANDAPRASSIDPLSGMEQNKLLTMLDNIVHSLLGSLH